MILWYDVEKCELKIKKFAIIYNTFAKILFIVKNYYFFTNFMAIPVFRLATSFVWCEKFPVLANSWCCYNFFWIQETQRIFFGIDLPPNGTQYALASI